MQLMWSQHDIYTLAVNRAWPLPELETANDGKTQIATGNRENPKNDM